MSKPNLVSGPTSSSDVEQARKRLEAHLGDTIEVKLPGERAFAGTLKSLDPVTTDDHQESKVGLEVTVEKRKLGGTVTFSTSFRDDDFDEDSYIREF